MEKPTPATGCWVLLGVTPRKGQPDHYLGKKVDQKHKLGYEDS